ncbi:murein hydrolase activator EnvC family protein [Psychrobium sp. nBUS_13]|uniref:murein hydrolase activator EnvC family protein n=1 Tax=Psychrobium sp. nBUS_13 TaxID=3395319 RepID=UPI003EB78BEC
MFSRHTLVLLITLLLSSVSFADDTKDQLNAIKGKIDQQKSILAKQKKQQQRLNNLLRDTDKKIASSANDLFNTQQQQKTAQQNQIQLVSRKKALTKTQTHQRQVLAKQLKSAYMTGNHDLMQLLLNQEQSSKTERLLGYYHYLNKARVQALNELKQTFEELQTVEQQLIDTLAKLDNLLKQQQQAQALLKKQKKTRSTALAQLRKSYQTNSAQLEQYQLSELDIKQLLANQQQEAEPTKKPLNGLGKLRGRLAKPTKGRTTHLFGQKRSGQLRWKGVTVVGREGQSVNAVYHGKVVFSDWLKGFGLVLVLDHGSGYMSLYGHNQALLKKAGDYVEQNEQVALLGQSGGQSTPGLYFEIRHKGKAINPNRWFKK